MNDRNPRSHLTRRNFIKASAIVTATAGNPSNSRIMRSAVASTEAKASVRIQDNRIHVETSTLEAVLEKGHLRSLKSKLTGDEFIQSFDLRVNPALQLIYRGDEELRMRIHEEHGAIPTITIRSAKEITEPNPAVKRILDRSAGA